MKEAPACAGAAAYFFDFRFAFLAFFAFFAFFAISISNGLRKRIKIIQAMVVIPKGIHQKPTEVTCEHRGVTGCSDWFSK
jgi:hypothetical protein